MSESAQRGAHTSVRVDVNTISLESRAWRWSTVSHDLGVWCTRWSDWVQMTPPGASYGRAASDGEYLSDVAREARLLAADMDSFATSLRRSSEHYATFEAQLSVLLHATTDVFAWHLGRLGAVALVVGAPLVLLTKLAGHAATLSPHEFPAANRPAASADTSRFSTRVLSNPLTVTILGSAVGSIDFLGMGMLGIPLPLAVVARAIGVTSVAGGARLASRLNSIVHDPAGSMEASAGDSKLAEVSLENVNASSTRAPDGFEDLVSRIPAGDDTDAQIRIDTFGDTHIVYIGGTVDSSLSAGAEPWDMTSNLALIGDDPSASENAVLTAMEQSGITRDDPVVLVGHSQGGAIALRVAQSEAVKPIAIVTAGAPIHQMTTPEGVPVIAFEHRDDLVPVLGGPVNASGTVYVTRSALGPSDSIGDETLPAHRLTSYRDTARVTDSGYDSRLTPVTALLAALPPAGTSRLWRARRIAGAE